VSGIDWLVKLGNYSAMARASEARDRLIEVAFDLIWSHSYMSVSVDAICDKAKVLKGSFYHFFPSKADLAIECMEDHWTRVREKLDRVFSPQVEPLERIRAYCMGHYEVQRAQKDKCGRVLGCPFCSVGSELSSLDDRVRQKAAEILNRGHCYLESAIAEGQRNGSIEPGDPRQLSQVLFAMLAGLLLQAKIYNDPEILANVTPRAMRLIGAREKTAA
jgi:TetR/AcrR family transcriptional repressor of nem operon